MADAREIKTVLWWGNPCSSDETPGSKGYLCIRAYSSSIMWPSLCGGKRLKSFCPEKFVAHKRDLGQCKVFSCIFLINLVPYMGTKEGEEGGLEQGDRLYLQVQRARPRMSSD